MANKTMKTLTVYNDTYIMVDETARQCIGDLTGLKTTKKNNLVEAINELSKTGGISKVSVNSISPDADGNIELGKEDVGIYTDESAPTNPQEGDLWFTTSNDSSGSGVLIVRVDPNREGYVTHTSIEIKEAIDNGQMVYLYDSGTFIPLVGIADDGSIVFVLQMRSGKSTLNIVTAIVLDTGACVVTSTEDNLVPSYANTDYGKLLSPSSDGLVWVNAPSSLPSGGTAGQVLTKGSDGNAYWADAPEGGSAIPSAEGVEF